MHSLRLISSKLGMFGLAALILLATVGTVSAVTPLSCTSTATSVQMRAEGQAEKGGDFILTCTGGSPTNPGQPAPTVTISVFLNVTDVTSRILDTTNNATEALLLIDEPTEAQQHVCTVANGQSNSCPVLGLELRCGLRMSRAAETRTRRHSMSSKDNGVV